jgi:hypothetical protein
MPDDGEPIAAADMTAALTSSQFLFPDGATQTFTSDGRTTYVENGRVSAGEWSVLGDERFASFWPPAYRATYAVAWIVEDMKPVGVSFTDARSGAMYRGRYR